ncbi:MAG TPA: hypothetical protein VL263_20895 [Vicinamibacterales bacterium]|nr:hypothetical protein [Vicinamibacterales bacterium]
MFPTRRDELAVVRAVTYASLFDYPLTLAQLRESLEVPADEVTLERWLREGPLLRHAVSVDRGYVSPRLRPELVERRLSREAASLEQLGRDAPVVRAIAALPFVRMVAISGSLAHLNAVDGADLDLFVVTSRSRVWTVAVLALALARAMGWRTRLCLNYIVSEAAMTVKPPDLFSANQIIHLRPVAGEPAYRAFLAANPFVTSHYPNFVPRPLFDAPGLTPSPHASAAVERALRPVASILERAARALYAWHLRRRSGSWHSPEHVQMEPECLKLHTNSHRDSISGRFEQALVDVVADARGRAMADREQPAMAGVVNG